MTNEKTKVTKIAVSSLNTLEGVVLKRFLPSALMPGWRGLGGEGRRGCREGVGGGEEEEEEGRGGGVRRPKP